MADAPVHSLTPGVAVADTDEFYAARTPYGVGNDVKLTGLQIKTYVGAGGVSSVSNADGTLVISPTTGAVVASARVATSALNGIVRPDNTSITISGGVISSISGGAGTVTNIATTAPITGGPITGTGTIGISTFTSSVNGAVPASGGGTTNFLRSDGAWAVPSGSGGIGSSLQITLTNASGASVVLGTPVYINGSGTFGTAIANAAVPAQAIGLAAATIANGAAGTVTYSGILTLSGGLTPGASYFLDPVTAGALTTTVTTYGGEYVTYIGEALSTTDMLINIDLPIATTGPTRPHVFSPQVQQFFDRLVTLPSSTVQGYYETLINSLVSGGVWSLLDALYILAAPTEDISFINLVSASWEAHILVGTPAGFVAYQGWPLGGAGGNYANTGFNFSTSVGHYSRNSALAGGWTLTNTGGTANYQNILNEESGVSYLEAPLHWSDNHLYWAVNGGGEQVLSVDPTDTRGWWIAQRTGSTASAIYQNNVQLATAATTSTAMINQNITIGQSGSVTNVAAAVFGQSLTTGQMTTLYNAVHAFLHSVGAV